MQKQNGILLLVVGLIIAGIAVVAVGGVWVHQNYSLTKKPLACTPNWQCGWGECKNGYQGQTAIDSNKCGLPSSTAQIACPALARECTISNCVDLDGGLNYDVFGNLTVTNLNGSVVTESDFCLSSKILSEAYCNSSIASHTEYTCPNMCSNGACK